MTLDLGKVGKKKGASSAVKTETASVPKVFDTSVAIMIVIAIAVGTAGLLLWKGTAE